MSYILFDSFDTPDGTVTLVVPYALRRMTLSDAGRAMSLSSALRSIVAPSVLLVRLMAPSSIRRMLLLARGRAFVVPDASRDLVATED